MKFKMKVFAPLAFLKLITSERFLLSLIKSLNLNSNKEILDEINYRLSSNN